MKKYSILWVDDEIELLRSHVIFLTEKGYNVQTVTNGEDAINEVKEHEYDLIFLDEMMPGLDGLETLSKIKDINPSVPVVMITKNEEESLMNDAIGSKISDYLIKPVIPSQILLVCKKILEKKKISEEYLAKDYLQGFNEISTRLLNNPDYLEWKELYLKLVNWEMELDIHPEVNLRETLLQQKKECNQEFGKFIENNYLKWINRNDDNTPVLSNTVLEKYVFGELAAAEGPVFLFVIDCLRLDQWLIMEKLLSPSYTIKKDYYYSILPTATSYARNALFSGFFPSEIENYYPELWKGDKDDENSQNKYEKELLQKLLDRKKIKLKNELKYYKLIDPEYGKFFEQNVHSHANSHFVVAVVNFLDMIAHGRSDSDILKEIAPDEPGYRSLTNSWFQHSTLFSALKIISKIPKAKVFITTDHGSIRTVRGSKVLGDREASSSLRFKFGRNLKVADKHAMFIKNPPEYKLPNRGVSINYIIAKEDYYFIYPTDYHKFLSYYKDSFQHGGISMEEMILPFVTMETKS